LSPAPQLLEKARGEPAVAGQEASGRQGVDAKDADEVVVEVLGIGAGGLSASSDGRGRPTKGTSPPVVVPVPQPHAAASEKGPCRPDRRASQAIERCSMIKC